MTTKKPTSEPKQEPQPYGLVGRCFHIFAEDGTIERQGIDANEASRKRPMAFTLMRPLPLPHRFH
jgi:hypothetical protein